MEFSSDERNLLNGFRRPANPSGGRAWLLSRLAGDAPLVAPGAYDAVSARLIEQTGFEAVYVGGYAAAASTTADPDLGLSGLAETLAFCRRMRRATSLPLIVDADTGFGGLINTARAVEELAAIGVTAIQIEDQVNPKQCGHLDEKAVVSVDEASSRIRAAVAAAGPGGPAIIARIDALAPEGMDSVVERAARYRAEGADVVLVDAPRRHADVVEIGRRLPGPLMFNGASTGKGPEIRPDELRGLGYGLVTYPIELLFAAVGAVERMLVELRAGALPPGTGTWRRPSFDAMNEFLGLPQLSAWERRIGQPADIPTTTEA